MSLSYKNWSETSVSEPLQSQQRKAPVLQPRAAAPQLPLPWAEPRAELVPPLSHWWMGSIWQQQWHFSTSTPSTTSFIATWFLGGFKGFLQKAASENNPCHVGSSQQSASALHLIWWHTQCILTNFGGKKHQKKKYSCVLCRYIIRRTNPWD